ncbi:MAG: ATP-binding protein [Elusimicrobia bacterium]|nr:ATP-binding protein [Elusimicrobiota bacterium]
MESFLRPMTRQLLRRLEEPPRLLQILIGPRQVGKTTAIEQVLGTLRRKGFAAVSVTADALAAPPSDWVARHWGKANALAKAGKPAVLAFDELQKIPGWSEIVKREFDANSRLRPGLRPRVVISGSSALMVEKGLTESLAGRFELIRFPHWSLEEEAKAFGVNLERYAALGGYPRLREFPSDDDRFLDYVRDSIIESVLSKDILLLHPVDKPVLLRRLFEFACHHPSEIVSLQKMLGQLTDKGNVTTIANYLDLLAKAFLVVPLQKYSPEILRIRSSSPKLIVMAQALLAAVQGATPADLAKDRELYGRWAENAVGAHLLRSGIEVYYWRERDEEIDFIARHRGVALAIEVTVSEKKRPAAFLERLARKRGISKTLVVGPAGVALSEFLCTDPGPWIKS